MLLRARGLPARCIISSVTLMEGLVMGTVRQDDPQLTGPFLCPRAPTGAPTGGTCRRSCTSSFSSMFAASFSTHSESVELDHSCQLLLIGSRLLGNLNPYHDSTAVPQTGDGEGCFRGPSFHRQQEQMGHGVVPNIPLARILCACGGHLSCLRTRRYSPIAERGQGI